MQRQLTGVVVDSLQDVLALGVDSTRPMPQMNTTVKAGYTLGMGCFKSSDV